MPSSIRVVIAAACTVIRTGLIAALEPEPGIQVVGTAVQCSDLLPLLHGDSVDVVVIHLHDGRVPWGFLHELKQAHPSLGIVVFAAIVDCAFDLLAVGVNAYVDYDEPHEHLHLAIWAAAQGAAMVHPGVAIRLMTEFNSRAVVPSQSDAAGNPLSEREQEILRLVARGATNRFIADRLTITIPTVKRHLSNILHKLQAVDRMAAVAQARARGFL